ncbi:MAG TPA: hypothetical protein VNG29_00430, partial [Candidatus Paceibacterota bacterium]|nr:hypothetical protein [Candidatus Paceibacterota bacterium]
MNVNRSGIPENSSSSITTVTDRFLIRAQGQNAGRSQIFWHDQATGKSGFIAIFPAVDALCRLQS